MLKKRILIRISVLLFIVTMIISCKKDNVRLKNIMFTVEFPDTLFVNQMHDGVIKYKSPLDTVITTFGDKKKNRYTRFILTTTNNANYNYKHLKKTVRDTFGALNNREIPFYDIKFTKSGTYYIDGIINDIVMIDLNKKDSEGKDLSRFIESEERVTHKVIVIDKKNNFPN